MRNGKFSPTAKRENKQETRIVALDCEMVGVGESGSKSALARVVVINYYGNVLIDTHCLPKERVTDYRTRVSGIRAADLKGAPEFEVVQKQVAMVSTAVQVLFQIFGVHIHRTCMNTSAPYCPILTFSFVFFCIP